MSAVDPYHQMKKGVVEIIVLRLLKDRELYGYQIIQEMANKSKGFFKLKEGTLYPVLYRLESAGYVQTRWVTEERQVPKKYYQITEDGARVLTEMQNTWINFAYNVNMLLN